MMLMLKKNGGGRRPPPFTWMASKVPRNVGCAKQGVG